MPATLNNGHYELHGPPLLPVHPTTVPDCASQTNHTKTHQLEELWGATRRVPGVPLSNRPAVEKAKLHSAL
jgi:hypothetical protein